MINTELSSSEPDTLEKLDIIFKIKKFKKGQFLDSYDDSEYIAIVNSLNLISVL
jgi:hypothetical protein